MQTKQPIILTSGEYKGVIIGGIYRPNIHFQTSTIIKVTSIEISEKEYVRYKVRDSFSSKHSLKAFLCNWALNEDQTIEVIN